MMIQTGKLDEEKLLNCMANYMKQQQLSNLFSKADVYSNPSSHWGNICREYYGHYDKLSALNIKTKYTRNLDFQKNVHQMIKALSEAYSVRITLEPNEWKNIQSCINESTRKKFRAEFTHFLSAKLHQNGINCYLHCEHNWFSLKMTSWNGKYDCIECGRVFTASIHQLPDKYSNSVVHIDIVCGKSTFEHAIIYKPERISGKKRELFTLKAADKGLQAFRSELLLDSTNPNEVVSVAALKMMKYECAHADRLDSNLLADCQATKKIYDEICESEVMPGFVQEIMLIPFGFLLFSDLQVKIWISIMEKNPIWYFDATGSILKKDFVKSPIFMYSLAMHDPTNHVIVSLADFFTSNHTSMMISKYLFTIKSLLMKCTSRSVRSQILPRYVVTDHSFALINSVLGVINQCTLTQYLNFTYELIFKKQENQNAFEQTRLHICSVHFLKIIVTKAKKENVSNETRNFFVFCFSILQNATSIELFERFLLHIYNVFMQPKLSKSCMVSINMIKNELKNRNLYRNVDLSSNQMQDDKIIYEQLKYIDLSKNNIKSIKQCSPFTIYFDKLISRYKTIVVGIIETCDSKIQANPFFQPSLLSIIIGRLWHVSMWSGILVNHFSKQSRLCNNNVECYFKILKNHWIKDRKSKLMPSEVACMLHKKSKSTYLQHYQRFESKPNNEKNANLDFAEEKWKKSKSNNRDKGFFYKNITDETMKMDVDHDVNNLNELHEIFDPFEQFDLRTGNVEYDLIEHLYENPLERKNELHEVTNVQELQQLEKFFQTTRINEINIDQIYEEAQVVKNKQDLQDLINKADLSVVLQFLSAQNPLMYSNQRSTNMHEAVLIKNNLKYDFIPVKTEADGNCFYYSTSMGIFGSPKIFKLVKIGLAKIFLDHEQYFQNVIFATKITKTFDDIIIDCAIDKAWANEIHILALSLLLKRPVICFSEHNYQHLYCALTGTENNKPLVLLNASKHFDVLMPLTRLSNAKANFEQFQNYKLNSS